jgi:hypothetical protein
VEHTRSMRRLTTPPRVPPPNIQFLRLSITVRTVVVQVRHSVCAGWGGEACFGAGQVFVRTTSDWFSSLAHIHIQTHTTSGSRGERKLTVHSTGSAVIEVRVDARI